MLFGNMNMIYKDLYYLDAGIINNFSIDLFDIKDKEVIGFAFKSNNYVDIKSFQEFIKTLIFAAINEKEQDIIKKYKHCSVLIDCDDFSLFDFDISDDDKKKLFQLGYTNVKNFFDNIISNKWYNLKIKLDLIL